MSQLSVNVPPDVANVLHQQARVLRLGRQEYVRALLCAVAADAGRLQGEDPDQLREKVPA